jgi:hypothetical protein
MLIMLIAIVYVLCYMYMYLFVVHSLWKDFFAYVCTYASCILAAYWKILALLLKWSNNIINLYEEYGIWYEGKGRFTNFDTKVEDQASNTHGAFKGVPKEIRQLLTPKLHWLDSWTVEVQGDISLAKVFFP